MKDLEKLVATFNRAHTEDGKRVEHEFRAVWNAIPGLIEECMAARAVVEAARSYVENLGLYHYWRCESAQSERWPCTCGSQATWDALAAYDRAMEGK